MSRLFLFVILICTECLVVFMRIEELITNKFSKQIFRNCAKLPIPLSYDKRKLRRACKRCNTSHLKFRLKTFNKNLLLYVICYNLK